MKRLLSLLVLLSAVTAARAEAPATEWRRLARRLIFHKAESGLPPFFVVVDRLSAADGRQHAFEQLWHLENCTYTERADSFSADFGGGVWLTGTFSQAGLVDKKGQHTPEYQGWMPIHTGDEHEHRAVHTPTLCGTFDGALRLVTVFMPTRGTSECLAGVRAASDSTARDYTLLLSDGSAYTFSEEPVAKPLGELFYKPRNTQNTQKYAYNWGL